MAVKTIIIKNIDTVDNTYAGQTVLAGDSYTIQDETERVAFAKDSLLNQHIWAQTPLVCLSDGIIDYVGEVADSYLKMIDPTPRHADGKAITHQTARPLGTTTCFVGIADDDSDPHAVGGGIHIKGKIASGVGTQVLLAPLNTIYNSTYIHEGYVNWDGCTNDTINVTIVPKLTTVIAGTNTNYNLYGGYLVIPAAGDGTIDVTEMVLVQIPLDENGNRKGAGYWDADWDSTNKIFINIAANPYSLGEFNMFTVQVPMGKFIDRHLLGNGAMRMETSDNDMFGHNMLIKFEAITNSDEPAHDWYWNSTITLYRKKTV